MVASLLPQITDQPSIQVEADNRRWYAVCGTRLYSIATLAGQFPDMGFHQPKEMGGVWAPPLKLLDGYWLGIRAGRGPIRWLTSAVTWRIDPEGVTLTYQVPELGVEVERREWVVPDQPALVVEVTLRRHLAAKWKHALTLTCGFLARSDLHGAWLAERLGWLDGDDVATYDEGLAAVVFRDLLHAWDACVGATQIPVAWQVGKQIWGPERTTGRGTGAALWYRCRITPDRPAYLRILIAGAPDEESRAKDLFMRLMRPTSSLPADAAVHPGAARSARSVDDVLAEAKRRAGDAFRQPFTQCVLQSPDPVFDAVFAWMKASSSMLMLEVPGVGRGAMAGLPEFPWWFGCDLAYGVLPMLPAGQGAFAADSLRLLAKMSQGEGAVPHEVVSHGVVFHNGNLVEIPLFVRALYHTYRWTGDRCLLEELFPFCLQGIEHRTLNSCLEPGEQVPNGTSIVETPEMAANLQTLDVAAYLVEALDLLSALASDLACDDLAVRLRTRAAHLRQHVRESWWLPDERLFGDARASRHELQALLERFEALSSPESGYENSITVLRHALAKGEPGKTRPDVRQPWLLLHMVQALAADAGLPDADQATQLLQRLETPEWLEKFGLVLNAATNRRVMTLPTGALAAGEARYGRADAALAIMRRMARAFGAAMPGTLSEYAPNDGCFLQLWSNYGIIWPVIHYFFGLRPDVASRQLVCVPQLPSAWPYARLSALTLGEMRAQIDLTALSDGMCVRLETTDPTWMIRLGVALPPGARITRATINGASVELTFTRLAEPEERNTWLTPAMQGTSRYELSVSWSGEARFTYNPGEISLSGYSPAVWQVSAGEQRR